MSTTTAVLTFAQLERVDSPPRALCYRAQSASGESRIDLFTASGAAAPPQRLHDVQLSLAPDGSLLSLQAREGLWSGDALVARVFVHRTVQAQIAAAIPPRPAPWLRSVFWRALPALLGSRLGRALLAQRYGP